MIVDIHRSLVHFVCTCYLCVLVSHQVWYSFYTWFGFSVLYPMVDHYIHHCGQVRGKRIKKKHLQMLWRLVVWILWFDAQYCIVFNNYTFDFMIYFRFGSLLESLHFYTDFSDKNISVQKLYNKVYLYDTKVICLKFVWNLFQIIWDKLFNLQLGFFRQKMFRPKSV